MNEYFETLKIYGIELGNNSVSCDDEGDKLVGKVKTLISTIQNHFSQFETLYMFANTILLLLIYLEVRKK